MAAKIRHAQARGETLELSRDEMAALFERMTRRELGMSAKEFFRRLDDRTLPDNDAAEYLSNLAGGARTG